MMNKEEIQEILNKLSNRKQETLLQGLRECQLKNIEHPFITKEEYIDKILNYIEDLQQRIDKVLDFIEIWKKEKVFKVSMIDLYQIEEWLLGGKE